MQKIERCLPLTFLPGARAKKVSLLQRACAMLFGAPNARRAHGVIYSGMDVFGGIRRMVAKLLRRDSNTPVFEIDRRGTVYEERLPRIWLSEQLFNTKSDGSSRVFVECYPSGPDIGGARALELGDRYLCEGYRRKKGTLDSDPRECFQAAEILYLHSARRGNREAARRLRDMYEKNLCEGKWHESYLEMNAKHALRRRGRRCVVA